MPRDETVESIMAIRAAFVEAGHPLAEVVRAYPLPAPEAKLEERFAKGH